MSGKRKSDKSDVKMKPVGEATDPKLNRVNELVSKLISKSTELVIKTAACKCRMKNTCPLYAIGQDIAEIIDELQEIQSESPKSE